MKKTLLALFALAAFGCKEMPGSLVVHEAFQATTKNGIFSRQQTITVPAGEHFITLNGTLGGDLTIEIPLQGRTQKIRLDIPRKGYPTQDGRFPQENGQFRLTPAQLKQPFHLSGEVRTTYVDGRDVREIESCTTPRQRVVCVVDRQTGASDCSTEIEYVHGRQEVTYYPRTATKKVWIELSLPANPGTPAAKFNGTDVTTSKIYTYRGLCHPHLHYW